MTQSNLYYRIAGTEAGLSSGYFLAIGLPPPRTSEYRDHSVRRDRSDGRQARHGHSVLILTWDKMTPRQANYLRTLIEDNDESIYLTFNRASAEGGQFDWVDARGEAIMPDFQPQGPISTASGIIYDAVELEVRAIQIVNDPASF